MPRSPVLSCSSPAPSGVWGTAGARRVPGLGAGDAGSARRRAPGAAARTAPDAPGRWHQISVCGRGRPAHSGARSGAHARGRRQQLPPRHVPGARPGARQTGLQVILATGPEPGSLSPRRHGHPGSERPRGVPGAARQDVGGEGPHSAPCRHPAHHCRGERGPRGALPPRGRVGEGARAGAGAGTRLSRVRGG